MTIKVTSELLIIIMMIMNDYTVNFLILYTQVILKCYPFLTLLLIQKSY